MLKYTWVRTIISTGILGVLACAPFVVRAEDPNCPERDWAEVKRNLEYTANTPGPENRGCAEVKVHSGKTAYDAFKDCNGAFRGPGLIGGRNKDLYTNCAPYVCNWFRSQNPPWSPAC